LFLNDLFAIVGGVQLIILKRGRKTGDGIASKKMLLGVASFTFEPHQPLCCLTFDVELCRQQLRPHSVIVSLRSSSLRDINEEGNNEEQVTKEEEDKIRINLFKRKRKEKKNSI
jgi:hypothetical protein